jgi:hypothetical protein
LADFEKFPILLSFSAENQLKKMEQAEEIWTKRRKKCPKGEIYHFLACESERSK